MLPAESRDEWLWEGSNQTQSRVLRGLKMSLISSFTLLSLWFTLILALSVSILKVASPSLAQQETGKSRGFGFTSLSAFSEGRIQIPWNMYQLSMNLLLEHMEGDTWQYKVHRIFQRNYSYTIISILIIYDWGGEKMVPGADLLCLSDRKLKFSSV